MLKEKEAVFRRLTMVADFFLISGAFFISFLFRENLHLFYKFDLFPASRVLPDVAGRFGDYLLVLFVVALLWCYLLHRGGIYNSWRMRKSWQILWIVCKATFSIILISGAVFFLFKLTFVSRLFFVTFILLGFLFIAAEKIVLFSLLHEIRRRGYIHRQVLIIGTGRRAEEFIRRINRHPEWGLRIFGAIEDEAGRAVDQVDGVKVIGEVDKISDILHQYAIDEVVIVVPRLRLQSLEKAIGECETEGVNVTIAVDLFDLKIAKAVVGELDGVPLLTFHSTVPNEWDLLAKRMMDIFVSGIVLVLLSPVLLAIALIIRLTSRGPALFKQERIGFNKRRFTIYKFRTMVEGAQKNLGKVDIYQEIYESAWKAKKLQNATPFGKLLRKFSLDEFPQFVNVFLGQMSLVGPRPTLPGEVEQYEGWHRRRFSMRPGLTCLWQVSGRREIEFDEWMKMDLEYLDHWSFWLDIKILLKTIPAVLFGAGAY